tara:strand:- start:156 stop:593 length:438 start_codon:yes stop_codon:yes gene_type:complete
MINKVMLVGKVKSQPQQRGAAVAFRMGTWRIIGDGRRFDSTHSVEAFGRNGEIASTLKEGELVAVEGSIKHSSYEKNGQKVWFTSVSASSVGRVGEPADEGATQSNQAPQVGGQAPANYPPNKSNGGNGGVGSGASGQYEKEFPF